MKWQIVWLVLLLSNKLSYQQQCRQVTVCNDDTTTSGKIKGQKGDTGFPGKTGPMGMKGSKGDIGGRGEKGIMGESCALGTFETEIRQKLSELKILLTPATCLTSSVYGPQTLRSGEEVFCDNGWTVFLRVVDNNANFDQGWNSYQNRIGNLNGSFWLGLDEIHKLTEHRGCKLRVDLWKKDDEHEYATYSDFYVEGEDDDYRLHVSGYSGTTARDNFAYHDKKTFSTKDHGADSRIRACASNNNGGWWYGHCAHSVLTSGWNKMYWHDRETRKEAIMKLRCD